MARTAVGYFRDRPAADRAYEQLVQRGFSRDDIGILGRGADGKAETADTGHDVKAGEGAAAGGIFGLLLGAAAMLIPGIGPIVAVGPIAAALAGAVTGGVTGAVVGGITAALVHAGVPEDEAAYYDERFKQGGYLVTVHTDDARYHDARAVLQNSGAEMRPGTVNGAVDTATPAAVAGTERRDRADTEGRERVQLREEELRARKETVQAGEVEIRKEVVTEQKTIDVPVRREEVVVERRPVSGRPSAGGELREGEEIRVPLTEERVHLEKQPVVTEEVSVGTRQVQDTERLSGTVRREEARVETEGDVHVRGDADRPNRK